MPGRNISMSNGHASLILTSFFARVDESLVSSSTARGAVVHRKKLSYRRGTARRTISVEILSTCTVVRKLAESDIWRVENGEIA